MKIGKLPESVLKRSVFKQIHTRRPEVVLGAGVGEDCAAIKLAEDETLVMSTDPITGTAKDIGTLAIQITVNDLASAGAEPVGVLLTVLLPESVEAGQVRNVDVVDRAHRLPVQEKRHQPGGSLYIIEGYALRGQSAVGAVREDRLGPLFEKHLPLSGFEPLGINVQFLNNNIFISLRKRCAASLDHRQRTLPDAQFLGERLLRQPQLFAYQPQSLPHIEKIFFAIISCKKSTKFKI